MFSLILSKVLLPLAVDTVVSYIQSSDTKKDDKVLKIVQEGATYLANQPNNTVSSNLAKKLKSDSMRPIQNSKE